MTQPPLSDLLNELQTLSSEQRNSLSHDLDCLSTTDLLTVINQADSAVSDAVKAAIPSITKTVDAAVYSIQQGGRLIYIGAGTSGRLGILDAVECRPTFSVPDDLVIGVIAGGETAIQHAVEGAEDDTEQGKRDLAALDLQPNDCVVGIAASGRTPYVIGAMDYAASLGATTCGVTCNPAAILLKHVDIGIVANVGPEVLTGSTRMKSGTAQKLVLNMISTAAMVKLGKTYGNLMVDVNATNDKLRARAVRIVMQATDCTQQEAVDALDAANNQAKVAILMVLTELDATQANAMLTTNQGYLRNAVDAVKKLT